MNILLIIDDKFVPQAAACINSIYTSSCSDETNSLYVMSYGISECNQRKLITFANSLGFRLTIVDITGFTAQLGFDFDTSGWNEIVLARLLMARFLPNDLHRVLYLDADVIVRRPLDDLWTMDLNGCVLGMALGNTLKYFLTNVFVIMVLAVIISYFMFRRIAGAACVFSETRGGFFSA